MSGPHLVVAVPARDEADRVGAAIAAIRVAEARLLEAEPTATTTLVVAADGCTDDTARIAMDLGAAVVVTATGVGGARRAAVEHGLAVRPDACWIANTDADSLVPPDWLRVHLEAARSGAAVLLGSVRPDRRELDPLHVLRWLHRNPPSEQHGRVHGANLGVSPAAWLASGGFPPVTAHEDVRLVRRCRMLGLAVRSTDREPVVTSARTVGRAPAGFGAYLADLVREAG